MDRTTPPKSPRSGRPHTSLQRRQRLPDAGFLGLEDYAAQSLPAPVEHHVAGRDVMEVRGLCRQAGIQQIDAGPKGCILSFRGNRFANPSGLVAFMQKSGGAVKLQTDHKLVLKAVDWDMPEARLHGVRDLVKRLVALVPAAQKAA
jgi:transcription-repair coupling factor (superfamily II helicase)